jgi:hypothetical protein
MLTPPHSTTHSRHLHYIAATPPRATAVRTIAATRIGGEGSSRGPSGLSGCLRSPSRAAASAMHPPTTTAVRFSHLASRGGGGKGEQPRPISLPGCPSRSAARRATVASLITATLLSSPSEEKRGMGRRELPRPQAFQAAPPHSTIQQLHRPEAAALAT